MLFVATLLASVWAFCVLIAARRARNTALWMAFWDLVALAGLIVGVARTANIANYACNVVAVNSESPAGFNTAGGGPFTSPPAASPPSNVNGTTTAATANTPQFWADPNNCSLIGGAWQLAVANIVMFFITAMLAIVVYRSFQREEQRFPHRGSSASYVSDGWPPSVVEKQFSSTGYPQRPRRAKRSSRHSRSSGRTRPSSSYLYSDGL